MSEIARTEHPILSSDICAIGRRHKVFNDKVHKACSVCGYFLGREALNGLCQQNCLKSLCLPLKLLCKNKSKEVQPLIPVKDPQTSSNLDCTLLIYIT